jgi:hypothetical protein
MFNPKNRFLPLYPTFLYETVDTTSSGSQGAPAEQGTTQPGQGQPQQGGTGLDWGMYPNVPEEHRALLEPTLREQIQPYVTRLEQQYAPFKQFEGVTPEDATGLLQMAQSFEQDPVGTWLHMANALNEAGHLSNVDLEVLQELATGEFQEEPQEMEGVPPQVAQQLQSLTQWQQQQMQREQQREQQRVEERQNAAYNTAVSYIRQQAEQAGFPKGSLSDEHIRAAIVVGNGNREAALKHLVDLRSQMVKGFVQTNTTQTGRPTLPNGAPPSRPERQRQGGNRSPGFDGARTGAEQFLRQQNQASARG